MCYKSSSSYVSKLTFIFIFILFLNSKVSLPLGLLRRVEAYLGDFLSQKSRTKETFPDVSFSRSSSSGSIGTDEGLFEQLEPVASNNAVMEKALWRRSLQLREKQQAWQVCPTLICCHNTSFLFLLLS